MKLPPRLVHGAMRGLVRPVLGPPVPLRVQRGLNELLFTGAPLPKGTVIDHMLLGGRPAERVRPGGADDSRAVLLLHGGAFMTCSPRTHRVLAAHLAAAAGVPVYVADYRRAPEHPWPAPVQDAVAAYDELSARMPTAVAGDSTGGTLAMLLARERRPVSLALISPLVDLTLASSRAWPGRDALIRDSWAKQGCDGFVGGADARALSPLFDDLADLPPLLVHVSGVERLRPEGEELVARARTAGVDAELVLLPELWHDVHMLSHLVAKGAEASASMGLWLGVRLGSR